MSIRFDLKPLETTADFPYSGRTVAFNNSDWANLYGNLRKAQRRLGVVTKVMMKTGLTVWARAMIYKVAVMMVLLYVRNS